MKKDKKFRPHVELEVEPKSTPNKTKKKNPKLGPKKKNFSKYSLESYYEEE